MEFRDRVGRGKFRIGERVKVKGYRGLVVKITGRDKYLPNLWFTCSDGFLRRVNKLRKMK